VVEDPLDSEVKIVGVPGAYALVPPLPVAHKTEIAKKRLDSSTRDVPMGAWVNKLTCARIG
jgi:hypothetical protein